MMEELHKNLVNYFTCLQKLDDKWKELFELAQHSLRAMKSQSEQLCLVLSNDVDNAEICKIENLRDKLIFKILVTMENEMTLLLDILKRFNNAKQDLKNRLINLENCRSNLLLKASFLSDFINGTPTIPKLNSLLEWAIESFEYYHELYLHINGTLKLVNYKSEETITNLANSFTEDKNKRAKLNRILAFIQFLIKEKSN